MKTKRLTARQLVAILRDEAASPADLRRAQREIELRGGVRHHFHGRHANQRVYWRTVMSGARDWNPVEGERDPDIEVKLTPAERRQLKATGRVTWRHPAFNPAGSPLPKVATADTALSDLRKEPSKTRRPKKLHRATVESVLGKPLSYLEEPIKRFLTVDDGADDTDRPPVKINE